MPIDWNALLNAVPALMSLAVAVGVLITQRRTSRDRDLESARVLVDIQNNLQNNHDALERTEKAVNEVKVEVKELKSAVDTTQRQQAALCQYHRMNHPGQII